MMLLEGMPNSLALKLLSFVHMLQCNREGPAHQQAGRVFRRFDQDLLLSSAAVSA